MKDKMRWLALAVIMLVAWVIEINWPHIRNEFFVMIGSRNETGGWYGFHSGMGGAAYVSLPVVMSTFWWHNQCGVSGCYWYARSTTAAGDRACWKHHPHQKRSAKDIHDAHHEALQRQDTS